MKISVLTLLSVLAASCLFSQNPEVDFKMMNEAYTNRPYKLKLEYKMYQGHQSTKVVESHEGLVVKDGNNMYFKAMGIETIKTSTFNLVIDHNSKTMMYDIFTPSYATTGLSWSPARVDSVLNTCGKIEYSRVEGDKGRYVLFDCTYNFEKTSVIFSSSTFLIEAVHLYNRQEITDPVKNIIYKPRLEILYTEIVPAVTSYDSYFTVDKYLVGSPGKSPALSPSFSEYELVFFKE